MVFSQGFAITVFLVSFICLSNPNLINASLPHDTEAERCDLTHLPFVTIDPENAQELDDALYAEQIDDGGFHIAIAIAVPTSYIPAHSEIAHAAQKQRATRYEESGKKTMLPEKIAALCSLIEGEDRPALIVDFYVDDEGNFMEFPTLYRATIRSRHKFSYEQVQAIYNGYWQDSVDIETYKNLDLLRKAAQALHLYTTWDYKDMSSKAVVSEMMLTANNAAAMHLKRMEQYGEIDQGLYRTQDRPEEGASYSCDPSYHASLGLVYTHFTSPLRRYADMMVHWLLFDQDYTFSEKTLRGIDSKPLHTP